MELYEYLEKNGVNIIEENFDRYYENLEAVDGKHVWVSDYRLSENDILNKPLRNITPTLVEVFIGDKSHRIYYSPIGFHPISDKTGKPLSRIIQPFDNTGYRMYSGNCLGIFETKEECEESYKHQVNDSLKRIKEYKSKLNNYIDNRIKELEDLI